MRIQTYLQESHGFWCVSLSISVGNRLQLDHDEWRLLRCGCHGPGQNCEKKCKQNLTPKLIMEPRESNNVVRVSVPNVYR